MFIDIHAHAFRKTFFQVKSAAPWPSAAQLIEFYDRIGVEKAVLLPLIGPEFYLPQANEDILEMAEQYPGRFIPFCNIHPRAVSNDPHAPLEEVLQQYKNAGCKGVGEVISNMSFFDHYMRNFFRAVEKVGLPLTFHLGHRIGGCYGIYDMPGLPGLAETLQYYPDLIMLGHSQTFWSEVSVLETAGDRSSYPTGKVTEGAVPKLMRRYKNLYGDLSAGSGANALMRDPEFAAGFMAEFQDRLLFGIDICSAPGNEHQELADFLLKMRDENKITETVFNKIARENAQKLLK